MLTVSQIHPEVEGEGEGEPKRDDGHAPEEGRGVATASDGGGESTDNGTGADHAGIGAATSSTPLPTTATATAHAATAQAAFVRTVYAELMKLVAGPVLPSDGLMVQPAALAAIFELLTLNLPVDAFELDANGGTTQMAMFAADYVQIATIRGLLDVVEHFVGEIALIASNHESLVRCSLLCLLLL
jgi:hypothetical protein